MSHQIWTDSLLFVALLSQVVLSAWLCVLPLSPNANHNWGKKEDVYLFQGVILWSAVDYLFAQSSSTSRDSPTWITAKQANATLVDCAGPPVPLVYTLEPGPRFATSLGREIYNAPLPVPAHSLVGVSPRARRALEARRRSSPETGHSERRSRSSGGNDRRPHRRLRLPPGNLAEIFGSY